MISHRLEKKENKENINRLLKQKWRRYEMLWKESRKLGMVKLETPIRRGWVRQFALSEESKHRKDSHVIAHILDLINTKMYSKDRNWNSSKCNKPLGVEYINGAHIENQFLASLTNKEYEKLDACAKKFFVRSYLYTPYSSLKYERWIIEKPSKFFRLKDSKHYIKEVPIFDAQIDRERTEIWNWIWQSGLYYKLAKAHGWCMHHDDDYTGLKQKIMTNGMKKEIRTYVDELMEVQYTA